MDTVKQWMRGFIKIAFGQGPQKLNDGYGKAIHPGMTDRGFTVVRIPDDGQSPETQ
jgi:hypothetical protein